MSFIQFTKTTGRNVTIPTAATPSAVGLDLYSSEKKVIGAFEFQTIDTGITVTFPPGTYGRIAGKFGLTSQGYLVGGGVIGNNATSIKVTVFNLTQKEKTFFIEDQIAQLICEEYKNPFTVDERREEFVAKAISLSSCDLAICEPSEKSVVETDKAGKRFHHKICLFMFIYYFLRTGK